jgi:hypothetical protein
MIVFTRRALSAEDGFDVDCWPPADLGTSVAAETSEAHNTKNKRRFFDLTDIANLLRGSEVVELPHNRVLGNRSATDMPFLNASPQLQIRVLGKRPNARLSCQVK